MIPVTVTEVRFYFDFLSPYSWLALMQAPEFSTAHAVTWDLRPVVFGKLLDAHGLTGPGEVEVRRQVMGRDIARCAALLGLPFRGPPAHPFRSLEALRTACLFRESPHLLDLCIALSHAAWGEGRDLADVEVIAAIVTACGLDAHRLPERLQDPSLKDQLRRQTQQAIDQGVFGVPSFVYRDEIFWGQDRMPHLAARIEGRLPTSEETVRDYLARPRALDRKASPLRRPAE